MNHKIEHWYSTNGNAERHYFLNSPRGLYLFGVNSKIVPPKVVAKILKLIKEECL